MTRWVTEYGVWVDLGDMAKGEVMVVVRLVESNTGFYC